MATEADVQAPLRRNLGVALVTLLTSSGTLVCCVVPAVMVALGTGAALAGLVTAIPQLVWLSEHKVAVFGVAFSMLALSGCLLWRARRLPCPSDMRLAYACQRLRRTGVALWVIAAACTVVGAMFAFVMPALG